jgi:hypothetical protein
VVASFLHHDPHRASAAVPGKNSNKRWDDAYKNASDIKNLQCRKLGPTKLANSPMNLLGGGSWRWPGTLQLDPAKHRAILEAEIGARST